ncbi:multidrug resistance-associated ABC transporter [Crassisporium funariophilum]|nr:multidrug resistance-associated ABC transporter [Crassisporium funariophilum]
MDVFRSWGLPQGATLFFDSFVGVKAPSWDKLFLQDTFIIPVAFACLCICLQALQILTHGVISFRKSGPSVTAGPEQLLDNDVPHPTLLQSIRKIIESRGGLSIFLYTVTRLVGCVALLALSLNSLVRCRKDYRTAPIMRLVTECPELFMTATFLYSSIAATVSLTVKNWSKSTTRYNIIVLLSAFGVYVYRDLWPLATFTEQPMDLSEGSVLWIKLAILTVTSVLIPLFIPRPYVPVDANNPMPEPNPEQTCSLFSLMVYTYLDPVIMLGYRVPHLRFDQLPPLSDTDYSQYLTSKAFPHMDPYGGAKRRHLFFSLMRVFRKEYSILALTIVGQCVFAFASPIGINRLLTYIETKGAGTIVRPWFWIFWLFAGPFARVLCFQWYIFIATRTLVHTEGLLTQLVFEHSLRIRLKAETSDDEKAVPSDQDNATVVGTPDSASTPELRSREGSPEGSASEHSQVSTAVSRETSSETQSTLTKGADNLIGKINNMVTTDLTNIVDSRDFLLLVLFVPMQTTLCMVFLYQVLGWSAFVGLGTIVCLFPVPGFIARKVQEVQRTRMKKTDARVQDVTEAVNVLRMIKLFGWEGKMSARLEERRDDELMWLWKLKVCSKSALGFIIPTLTMLATYATYTVVMKQQLNASKIFSSMTVFSMLRMQLFRITWQMTQMIQGKVSLDRLTDFLQNTELLDSFADSKAKKIVPIPSVQEDKFGFRNAAFSWSAESSNGSSTPSRRSFSLYVKDELLFRRGCINLIVGPTGSGKTSMLMALLGEMHFTRSDSNSWFNLPRHGGVAYAAQESWVQNETIRENILFGSPFDETRYNKVIKQCALERNLELFEAGDSTDVGERGLTLSGGQKARITLARAIYSFAEIILLDDVLAALDVHTSSWIIDNCFRGDLVKDRTILLVTHNVALASPIAQFIVTMGQDGSVRSQDADIDSALAKDSLLASELHHDEEVVRLAKEEILLPSTTKEPPAHNKLIMAEEIAQGHVTWKSMKLFLSGLGGSYPVFFFCVWIAGCLFEDWANTFQVWFLGYWGSQYETHEPSEVQVSFYLSTYSMILAVTMVVYTGAYIFYIFGALRASKKINSSLINSILTSTLRWLDETPTARIIARCTQDIRAVDEPIAQAFVALVEITVAMVTRLLVVVLFTPVFVFPGVAVGALGMYLGNLYLSAQLSVKREMSNARSPLLAHFSAAIAGIVSIRAYGAELSFKNESLKRINHYIRVARMSYNLNRWIGVRIDVLGSLLTAALASYLVYGGSVGAANTGFSLNMIVEFCTMILWGVRFFNELEVQANSLERIQGYIDIDHEPPSTESGKPPAAWPTSGDLSVERLSARYSQNGPEILHDLSFEIKSGERIGVGGRTGSGKSSLTLALLRCILTEGTVYYDGIPTNTLNLDALRSNITIIPQTPELLSGALRRNLDPFEQNDDATLNDALRAAGLFSLQEELEEARLTLDSKVASGGGNLSVGQRQIIALARAIVRQSKLLILDEATSAIDYKTDTVIQTTLRNQLGSDVTIITVAHRLQTIMDADKIMVLDDGRIVEFDSPQVLLRKEDGLLKALVDGSGDKVALYAMAEGRASTSHHQ